MKRVQRLINRIRGNRGQAGEEQEQSDWQEASSQHSSSEEGAAVPVGEGSHTVRPASWLYQQPAPFHVYEDPEDSHQRSGPSYTSTPAPTLRPGLRQASFHVSPSHLIPCMFTEYPYRLQGASYSNCCERQASYLATNPPVWFPCEACNKSSSVRVLCG